MAAVTMKHLVKGAGILSLATLISKVLSAIYRVPFQNMVGDTGFYVYQQVYPLYGIGMTLALSGVPVFLSKLVAEAPTLEQKQALSRQSQWVLRWFGLAACLGLWFGAPVVAAGMADPKLTPVIQMVALMYLPMPLLAAGRGYFQGTFEMRPTAWSQLIEQSVRVAVILIAAWVAQANGWSVYTMGTLAMSGAVIGALCASVQVAITWRKERVAGAYRQAMPYPMLVRRLLKEGGVITLFAAMLVGLQLIDSFTLTRGLMAGGFSQAAARAAKGVFDRGQPLVQLGLVAAGGLSASLLPGLTAAVAANRERQFVRLARQLRRFSFAISAAAALGLLLVMPLLNQGLFGSRDGTAALQLYSLAVLLVGMINTDNTILQSLNRYGGTTYALMLGLGLKVLLNLWLVPHLALTGAALATCLSLGAVWWALRLQLPAPVRQPLVLSHFGAKLGLGLAALSIAVLPWLLISPTSRWWALLLSVAAAMTGVTAFLWATTHWQLLTVREVLAIPFGRRLLRWKRAHDNKGR